MSHPYKRSSIKIHCAVKIPAADYDTQTIIPAGYIHGLIMLFKVTALTENRMGMVDECHVEARCLSDSIYFFDVVIPLDSKTMG